MTSTFAAPLGRGRHRFGRAGLVHVSTFVHVVHRGFFAALRRPGRHRPYLAPRQTVGTPAPAPAL